MAYYGVGVGVLVGVGVEVEVGVGVLVGVPVGVIVGVRVVVGVKVAVGTPVAVWVGTFVGIICTQVSGFTFPTHPEVIHSRLLQVLFSFWQMVMQFVSPQTNELRVGRGTGVAGSLKVSDVVGRINAPAVTSGVGTTVAVGVAVGVASEAAPFVFVTNVHGTPPLSYF
jgi:hypothetical protein